MNNETQYINDVLNMNSFLANPKVSLKGIPKYNGFIELEDKSYKVKLKSALRLPDKRIVSNRLLENKIGKKLLIEECKSLRNKEIIDIKFYYCFDN